MICLLVRFDGANVAWADRLDAVGILPNQRLPLIHPPVSGRWISRGCGIRGRGSAEAVGIEPPEA